MFCTGCGTKAIESDQFCGDCGHARREKSDPAVFHVGQEMQRQARLMKEIPAGVRGWSWGAFLLNWIWAVGNSTWIGLLALIPFVNIPMIFWLGINGREQAWRNRHWDSLDHFNRVQRQWSQWAVGIVLTYLGIVMMFTVIAICTGVSQAPGEPDDAVVRQEQAAVQYSAAC